MGYVMVKLVDIISILDCFDGRSFDAERCQVRVSSLLNVLDKHGLYFI